MGEWVWVLGFSGSKGLRRWFLVLSQTYWDYEQGEWISSWKNIFGGRWQAFVLGLVPKLFPNQARELNAALEALTLVLNVLFISEQALLDFIALCSSLSSDTIALLQAYAQWSPLWGLFSPEFLADLHCCLFRKTTGWGLWDLASGLGDDALNARKMEWVKASLFKSSLPTPQACHQRHIRGSQLSTWDSGYQPPPQIQHRSKNGADNDVGIKEAMKLSIWMLQISSHEWSEWIRNNTAIGAMAACQAATGASRSTQAVVNILCITIM